MEMVIVIVIECHIGQGTAVKQGRHVCSLRPQNLRNSYLAGSQVGRRTDDSPILTDSQDFTGCGICRRYNDGIVLRHCHGACHGTGQSAGIEIPEALPVFSCLIPVFIQIPFRELQQRFINSRTPGSLGDKILVKRIADLIKPEADRLQIPDGRTSHSAFRQFLQRLVQEPRKIVPFLFAGKVLAFHLGNAGNRGIHVVKQSFDRLYRVRFRIRIDFSGPGNGGFQLFLKTRVLLEHVKKPLAEGRPCQSLLRNLRAGLRGGTVRAQVNNRNCFLRHICLIRVLGCIRVICSGNFLPCRHGVFNGFSGDCRVRFGRWGFLAGLDRRIQFTDFDEQIRCLNQESFNFTIVFAHGAQCRFIIGHGFIERFNSRIFIRQIGRELIDLPLSQIGIHIERRNFGITIRNGSVQ